MDTVYDVTAIFDEIETTALPIGSTWLVNMNGEWECVTLIDCEPKGWGWCTVKWMSHCGWKTKSIPVIQLHDLDSAMDSDPKFARFEMDASRADAMED